MTDPLRWKHDFLRLSDDIEAFQQKYPVFGEAVSRLMHYHLDRARELLWAEVNGGLNEEYQDEADKLAVDNP